jgi:Na+/melibiose symporter-like transporter
LLKVLRLRDFRLLWLGEGISFLGDQFYLVALPWLVLQLTGNALATGTVLGLAGVPRAVFVLLGGALTDRLSPRNIMLTSNVLRLLLVAVLAALVLTGNVALWMLYVFALTFGLVDAFFYPASSSILPQIVELDDLPAANSLNQATAQVSIVIGPVLAGAMIALLAGGTGAAGSQAVPDQQGIGIAFVVDAISFLCSAVTLWLVHLKRQAAPPKPRERQNLWLDIREGLLFAWQDPALRITLLLVAVLNLCAIGPFTVGIPVLANSRFPEGALAYGVIMSAYGGGLLFGTLVAGTAPKPSPSRLGPVAVLMVGIMGLGLVLLGFVPTMVLAAATAVVMGAANGYRLILIVSWLQRRTPLAMLGRVMSLVMFAAVGFLPVSTALSGALLSLDLTALFAGAGGLLVMASVLGIMHPAIRAMGIETAR